MESIRVERRRDVHHIPGRGAEKRIKVIVIADNDREVPQRIIAGGPRHGGRVV